MCLCELYISETKSTRKRLCFSVNVLREMIDCSSFIIFALNVACA